MVREAFSKLLDEIFEEVRSGVVNYSSIVAESILLPINTLQLQQQLNDQSTAQSLQQVVSEQGFLGLYHGLTGRVIQSIASTWGFFVSQAILRSVFMGRRRQLTNRSSLIVDMLAQQVTSIYTNPIDVVANMNQLRLYSNGFSATLIQLAMAGNFDVLWRGLPATLILSTIQAAVFSILGTLNRGIMRGEASLSGREVFCIIAAVKTLAMLLMYPLIRTRLLIQRHGGSVWSTLSTIVKDGGIRSLYTGIGVMILKTVLSNAMVMLLVRRVTILLPQSSIVANRSARVISSVDGKLRQNVKMVNGCEKPWDVAARGATVGYVDGCWSSVHPGRNEHLLREAARRVDHLVVGIHQDWCFRAEIGKVPPDRYESRLKRILLHHKVTSVLEGAPWVVSREMILQIGISKVFSSPDRKDKVLLHTVPSSDSVFSLKSECSSPCFSLKGLGSDSEEDLVHWSDQLDHSVLRDPYSICKRLGIFEELPPIDVKAREVAWFRRASILLLSSPKAPASKYWDIIFGPIEQATVRSQNASHRTATKLSRQWSSISF